MDVIPPSQNATAIDMAIATGYDYDGRYYRAYSFTIIPKTLQPNTRIFNIEKSNI
jgi:hypothetical protein